MLRRARGQLKGPLALAGVVGLAACTRSADAVPAAGPAVSSPVATAAAPPGGPVAATSPPVSSAVTEATCATAPLRIRVVAVRHETADSIRVELALANLARAEGWRAGSPEEASVRAAVGALDGLSLLSADGRRRTFALRGSSGQRVGTPLPAPAPGHPATFWTLFPASEGPVSVLLPGFSPLSGLTVAPRPVRPEP